jgi:WhiB family redox-sensing transcriptional regulator
MSRYDWMENAACATVDPDLFHVEGQGSYNKALPVCRRCPVQRKCAAFAQAVEGATSTRNRHGLWAGQVPRQRKAASNHIDRKVIHESILRLHDRGGMNAKQIAEQAGCDERTVYRVLKKNRNPDSYREAA